MARPGQVIVNPVTKDRITFLETAAETGGSLLRFEEVVAADGVGPPAHVHPRQEERFRITAGTMRLRTSGQERTLGPGDEATLPPGTPHEWAPAGEDELCLVAEFRPALRTERFFETLARLAREGQVDARGMPAFLQIVLLVPDGDIWLAKPPLWLQRALFLLLTPLALLRGYRATGRTGDGQTGPNRESA